MLSFFGAIDVEIGQEVEVSFALQGLEPTHHIATVAAGDTLHPVPVPILHAEVNDTAKAIENIRGNALEVIAEI